MRVGQRTARTWSGDGHISGQKRAYGSFVPSFAKCTRRVKNKSNTLQVHEHGFLYKRDRTVVRTVTVRRECVTRVSFQCTHKVQGDPRVLETNVAVSLGSVAPPSETGLVSHQGTVHCSAFAP